MGLTYYVISLFTSNPKNATRRFQVNVIFLVYHGIVSINAFLVGRSFENAEFDDDAVNNSFEDLQVIFSGISVAVSIIVILGANRYNLLLVVRRRKEHMHRIG
mmetsp:Transcript_8002/g.13239  ORF Transcript_8002/g.13239 Transcript_8002/m.13239 type:complete len:103 (+) Transcript_8002:375-683(+)